MPQSSLPEYKKEISVSLLMGYVYFLMENMETMKSIHFVFWLSDLSITDNMILYLLNVLLPEFLVVILKVERKKVNFVFMLHERKMMHGITEHI